MILMNYPLFFALFIGNGSSVSISGQELDADPLPNEISAPYEVPQFPIEQIEKKLQIQRHLNVKYVLISVKHLQFLLKASITQ